MLWEDSSPNKSFAFVRLGMTDRCNTEQLGGDKTSFSSRLLEISIFNSDKITGCIPHIKILGYQPIDCKIIDMNEKILYQFIDQDLLDAQPDEWGVTIHCPYPKSIGYATTLTPSAIHQAAENNLELLVTHHDTWEFMLDERDTSHQLLAQYQISHIWCHEPLDKVDFGTAAALLSIIGCKVTEKIVEDFGRVGELPAEVELARIIDLLEDQMSEKPCRIHAAGKPISRIACVTGAGMMVDYLAEALDERIDLYITGETSLYLLEYAKYRAVNVLIYSHNYTEIFGTYNLARKIADHLGIDEVVRLEEPHF